MTFDRVWLEFVALESVPAADYWELLDDIYNVSDEQLRQLIIDNGRSDLLS